MFVLRCKSQGDQLYLISFVALGLYDNRSQKTSTCGKNISDTFLFLPHFDVICDPYVSRRMETWNLFFHQLASNTAICELQHSRNLQSNLTGNCQRIGPLRTCMFVLSSWRRAMFRLVVFFFFKEPKKLSVL